MAILGDSTDIFDFSKIYSSDVHDMINTFGVESGCACVRASP